MGSRSIGSPSYSGYSYPASIAYSLGQPIMPKIYPFTSPAKNFVNASILGFVGLVLYMISFASPYWLASYEYTYSEFKNMGLWEFCFDGYRYPKYQFDHKFEGCNYIFSSEYRIIWEWILPVWFMATQTFMCLGLISLMTAMILSSLILMRTPMQFVLRHEWHLTATCSLLMSVTGVCVVLSLVIFGFECWSRDWLLNPNFNYLGWSFYFLIFGGFFIILAAFMMSHDTLAARERKAAISETMTMDGGSVLPPLEAVGGEIPSDRPYAPQNPGYSQSLYSQNSAVSQPPDYVTATSRPVFPIPQGQFPPAPHQLHGAYM